MEGQRKDGENVRLVSKNGNTKSKKILYTYIKNGKMSGPN